MRSRPNLEKQRLLTLRLCLQTLTLFKFALQERSTSTKNTTKNATTTSNKKILVKF